MWVIDLAVFVVLLAGAVGIWALMSNHSYHAKCVWYKTPIAFILGFVSSTFFPDFITALNRITVGSFLNFSLVNLTMWIFTTCAKAACLYVGLFVYYRLCNQTDTAIKAGYALFVLMAAICVGSTYYCFVYWGSFIDGAIWIIAICGGIYGLLTIPKEICCLDQQNLPQ